MSLPLTALLQLLLLLASSIGCLGSLLFTLTFCHSFALTLGAFCRLLASVVLLCGASLLFLARLRSCRLGFATALGTFGCIRLGSIVVPILFLLWTISLRLLLAALAEFFLKLGGTGYLLLVLAQLLHPFLLRGLRFTCRIGFPIACSFARVERLQGTTATRDDSRVFAAAFPVLFTVLFARFIIIGIGRLAR